MRFQKIMPAGNRMESEAFPSRETGQQREYCLHFVEVYCQIALTSALDLSICFSLAKCEMLTEQHQCSWYSNLMTSFVVSLYAHHDKTAAKKGTLCPITLTQTWMLCNGQIKISKRLLDSTAGSFQLLKSFKIEVFIKLFQLTRCNPASKYNPVFAWNCAMKGQHQYLIFLIAAYKHIGSLWNSWCLFSCTKAVLGQEHHNPRGWQWEWGLQARIGHPISDSRIISDL